MMRSVVKWMMVGLLLLSGMCVYAQSAETTHRVVAGETLFRIAQTYGVSVDDLRDHNNISGNSIRAGQILKIPTASATTEPIPPLDALPTDEQPPSTHTVKRGETLLSIARQYKLDKDALRTLNQRDHNLVQVGETLLLSSETPSGPAEDPASTPDDANMFVPLWGDSTTYVDPFAHLDTPTDSSTALPEGSMHDVVAGETVYSIAAKYNISVDTLKSLNSIPNEPLQPGWLMVLPEALGYQTYTVKAGDTLFRIAVNHNVDLDKLRSVNRLQGNTIRVGQQLTIPGKEAQESAPAEVPQAQRGRVKVYPQTFVGRLTASGERYDPTRLTISHPDLPFDTLVLLTNPATGESTFAKVNDRGPLEAGFMVDISEAVADALSFDPRSLQPMEMRILR